MPAATVLTPAPIPGFTTSRVELSAGPIHYREAGSGDVVLFVHGFATNGRLFEPLATRLARRYRCIVPDWPMGSHVEPMRPDAPLTAPDVAALVAELCVALDLEHVTLVGVDTGGGICQLVVTRHPERIGRLVLTNCDAFEQFPPGIFKLMSRAMRSPVLTWQLVQSMRANWVRRSPLAFGMLTRGALDRDLLAEWVAPAIADTAIRRDMARFFSTLDPADLLRAADELPGFTGPAALIWGDADRFFTWDSAERLAALLPDSRLVRIPGGRTFCVYEDAEPVADAVEAFLAESVAV